MKQVPVKVKTLNPKAVIPQYQTKGAAGFDFHACLEEPIVINPGERRLIGTGLAMQIPYGYELQVRPRSGLALKKGISVVNSPGTVDYGYLDEIGIILINHGEHDFIINPGDRIAQGVLKEVPQAVFEEVEEFEGYNRGGGFGSSGK